jgi:hypothetical protein
MSGFKTWIELSKWLMEGKLVTEEHFPNLRYKLIGDNIHYVHKDNIGVIDVYYHIDVTTFSVNYFFETVSLSSIYKCEPTEWFTDISEAGVFCWVSTFEHIPSSKEECYIDCIHYYYGDGYSKPFSGDSTWKYATPLTKEELLERFSPPTIGD